MHDLAAAHLHRCAPLTPACSDIATASRSGAWLEEAAPRVCFLAELGRR